MNAAAPERDVYISFFLFTTDLRPTDERYRKVVIEHIRQLRALGYAGFEFPIAPTHAADRDAEVASYAALRRAIDDAGFSDVRLTTNVGATRSYDPSSPYPDQRWQALSYLKSRVDITAALRGELMMGPIVIPYGVFPVTDLGEGIWSDALQDALVARYGAAQSILEELGRHATEMNVKLAIEPITHWETPGPNTLAQLMTFLDGVPSRQVGVCIDSAHEVLDGAGPTVFADQVRRLADDGRLHYVQVSPPDRGELQRSWIPWSDFLRPILAAYPGPIAVEIFNAIPAFVGSLRLSRRKYWIPGEDQADQRYPDAYTIAGKALEATREHLRRAAKKEGAS
jgi:sugar phosphate isomerase/epimerase